MDSPLDLYLQELRLGLKGKVSRFKLNEIIDESRAHLEELILESVARGMSRTAAEQVATTSFGKPDEVRSWFLSAHQIPPLWKAARWSMLILALFILLPLQLPFYLFGAPIGGTVVYINLVLALMIWACFKAKRSTVAATVPAVVLYSVGLFVYMAAFCVPRPGQHSDWVINRATAAEHIRQAKIDLGKAEQRLILQERGHELFKTEWEPVNVPAPFKNPEGYATPMFFQAIDYPSVSFFVNGERSDGLEQTWAEARIYWQGQPLTKSPIEDKSVTADIASTMRDIQVDQRMIAELPGLLKTNWQDHVSLYARYSAMQGFLPLYFALVGDLLGAAIRLARKLIKAKRRSRMLRT